MGGEVILMGKKLCTALLCLLMTAGLWGCGQGKQLPELPNASITKIDLSAPKNKIYLDWLTEYYTQPQVQGGLQNDKPCIEPSSTEPKTYKPDIKESKLDDWLRQCLENVYSQEELAEESWKTWDWTDAWEMEVYCYKNGGLGWDVLRARNKATNEAHYIGEIFNDGGTGFWSRFEVVHIDEAYVIYRTGGLDIPYCFFLYAPTQEKAYFIGYEGSSGYLDEEHEIWWYTDYAPWGAENYNESAEHLHSLRFADFRKMTAGEKDAERIIFGGDEDWVDRKVWLAERGGHSTVYFYFSQITATPIGPGGTSYEYGPHYIGAYDPLGDAVLGYLELPFIEINYANLSHPISSGIYYYFDWQQAASYFKGSEDLDISAIDFYVIEI